MNDDITDTFSLINILLLESAHLKMGEPKEAMVDHARLVMRFANEEAVVYAKLRYPHLFEEELCEEDGPLTFTIRKQINRIIREMNAKV